jgi:hypothetical protein
MSIVALRAVAMVLGPFPKSTGEAAGAWLVVGPPPAGVLLAVSWLDPPQPVRVRLSTAPAVTTAARDPGTAKLLDICPAPR